MNLIHLAIATVMTASGLIPAASSLASNAPELRLTWTRLSNPNVNECVKKASEAMKQEGLGTIKVEENELVQGQTKNSRAKIFCIRSKNETLAAIAVSSSSAEEARKIRYGLKERMAK